MRPATALLIATVLAAPAAAGAQALTSPHLAAMQGRALVCLEARERSGELTRVRSSAYVDRWCPAGDACADEPLGAPITGTRYELRASGTGSDERLELDVRARPATLRGSVQLVLQPWTGGVSLTLAEDGGEQMTVGPEQCVDVPDGQICESTVAVDVSGVPGWHAALVRAHLSSAAALRDTTLDALRRLRERIERVIAQHALHVCSTPDDPGRFECRPGPGGSHGMFDTCVQRPLTADEEEAALRTARAEIARRERFVRRHHRGWHAAIDALFPAMRCWI